MPELKSTFNIEKKSDQKNDQKNKSNKPKIKGSENKSQIKGLWSEQVVIDFYTHKNWQLLSQRLKIKNIEIDLIFIKEQRLVFLEVKSLDQNWRCFDRVKPQQILRLKTVYYFLKHKLENSKDFAENKKIKINGYICFVSPNKKIDFLSIENLI